MLDEQYARKTLKDVVKSQHDMSVSRETIEKYIDKDIVKEAFDEIELNEKIDSEKERRKNRTTFNITKDHLKLLQRLTVDWQDSEYGAPAIDPKRPYGNSDVENDIREILGKKLSASQCRDIHEDMEIVLQILLRNGKLKTGQYTKAEQYSDDWKPLSQQIQTNERMNK